MEPARLLFCETPSRFLVSISPKNKEAFKAIFEHLPHFELGVTTATKNIVCYVKKEPVLNSSLDEIKKAWKRFEN